MASHNSIINDIISIIRLSINTLDSNTRIEPSIDRPDYQSTFAEPRIEPPIDRPDYQSTFAEPRIEPSMDRPDYQSTFAQSDPSSELLLACPICYNDYKQSENIQMGCRHNFCRRCIQKWFLLNKISCPLCRN